MFAGFGGGTASAEEEQQQQQRARVAFMHAHGGGGDEHDEHEHGEHDAHGEQEEDDQSVPPLVQALQYVAIGFEYTLVALKWGWMPFTLFMGASSAYSEPSIFQAYEYHLHEQERAEARLQQ